MKSYSTHDIGEFEIKSGKVIVSDPCYERGTWCAGTLSKVKKGKWNAEVLRTEEVFGGNRVAALVVYHSSTTDLSRRSYEWGWDTRCKIEVGVDSGQAGVFDEPEFHSEDSDYDNPNSWYRKCCDNTLNGVGGGTIEGGAVSSSGFGDGSYSCSTITSNGEIVAIMIDYGLMEEEEEEEED